MTLSPQNTTLQEATLKVRASKGVLIYLNSNGDSIKTSTYFGNTVKTTLNRYIPKYLTGDNLQTQNKKLSEDISVYGYLI